MLGLGLSLTQVAVRGGPSTRIVGPQILISNRNQDENTAIGTTIGTFTVVGGTGTYTFTKTADPDSAFTLTSGVLKNAIVFDYETATSHNVTIHADNGAGSTANRTLAISVNDIDEVPPVITVSPSQTVAENAAFSLTLTADKPVTWTKTGGADTALFTLTSGVLTMTAKDFETPTDANTDNAYVVQVTATSTAFAVSTNMTITVTVTDVAGPSITSSATFSVAENSAFSTTLTASESSTFAKTGGADTALFTLSGATLSMTAKDFEIPTDADANNTYVVQVKATSVATGEPSAAQTITVTVTDVTETGTAPTAPTLVLTSAANDNTPDFSLSGDLQVGDVVTINAYTDVGLTTLEDSGTGTVTGAGAITITGQLGPLADGAKWYDATTTRGANTSAISNILTNTIDTVAPTISSSASASVAENTTAVITATVSGGDTVAWSISGTDAAFFTINASTGVLVFTSAPDFETPLDAGANNVYNLTITATDLSGNATNQSFAATVTDVAEGGSTTTFDPATKSSHITLSAGNLVATTGAGSGNGTNCCSVASHTTGKFYCELTLTTAAGGSGFQGCGIANTSFTTDGQFLGGNVNSASLFSDGSQEAIAVDAGTNFTYTAGDVVCIALDVGADRMWLRKNGGSWVGNNSGSGTPNPVTGVSGISVGNVTGTATRIAVEGQASGVVWTANFGGSAYAQTVPSGFGNW